MTFITRSSKTVPSVTTEQMRRVDRIAIEETGPSLLQMMENAGRNLALSAMELMLNNWQQATYLFLAGKGGNGGGAICAARHLSNRGLNVLLYLAHDSGLSAAVKRQLQIFKATKGKLVNQRDLNRLKPQIIIDGLIGYSLRGKPEAKTARIIDWANQQSAVKLALDIPSGIDASDGTSSGVFFKADVTLTLALPKCGLMNENCGRLILADIGIPEECFKLAGMDFSPRIWGKQYRIEIFRQK